MPNQTVATGRLFPLQFTTDINGPSLLLTSLLRLEICCSVWMHRNSVWIVYTGCPPGHITNLAGTWHVTVVKGTQCCWKDPGDLVTAFIMSHYGSLWPGQPGPACHCNFSLYFKNTIFLSFQLLLSTTEQCSCTGDMEKGPCIKVILFPKSQKFGMFWGSMKYFETVRTWVLRPNRISNLSLGLNKLSNLSEPWGYYVLHRTEVLSIRYLPSLPE